MEIKGFSFSAVEAGIRYQDRLDLGLIYSDHPVVAAGALTTSLVKAAPVLIDIDRLEDGCAQAILVNSGCANACTGEAGMEVAFVTGELLAKELEIKPENILLSSTGVIGEPLNVRAFRDNISPLVQGLAPDNFEKVAQAIMTTDTVQKVCYHSVEIDGVDVHFMGMAKGAGMIMPNMATMLSFVITDAQIGSAQLKEALTPAVKKTFNRITVDGDTSTNDMVLVMANGGAQNSSIKSGTQAAEDFQGALQYVLMDLALKIVADGEGASKMITIRVCGAREDAEAEQVARTVANSSLVKTAFFGEDANWGRILAAMGRAGVPFDPYQVDISFGDVTLVRDGLAVGRSAEDTATAILKEKEITVCIDLKSGKCCEEVYTCDFSIDYVKINADYRS
ncbi:bifunctional glutamate N-acetyltransferase/amino-acid acetyltransferase ArgJ [Desulfotalea psychrophila]|uniref:Arginine biosynthesis bifunctional protein ArgJ n=1 Tax=Desulfotalea psychrophila (strain LSv54 / DSM 12343) TaxID=177439 RepID=ARGJ_DESPS|nr:bifunctional glutamate N-acetyltransferase/amino-acid acetyltransferase ArgJ [Desulfotalea psychrophila]Q6AJL0.1 RecName: Full=Arginine biosynthesis bifunctional protein ArgJ; Includes: RecName: Full=Glutamate N-acetyltransferase; AltName: Full=Ornithine acetyltransferase; Short=OATase; AltName: Full=Ornithine transacetylase; Includes: RecName: Full=Amino-acid acetyltransferase; AltName: Full=N-acetylglutamate synthase; Short=AGSase; Contains: RecName: Full=Arginine biosynthesis bifunctional pr